MRRGEERRGEERRGEERRGEGRGGKGKLTRAQDMSGGEDFLSVSGEVDGMTRR